jgi:2-phosphosulfolactate phosphatase
MTTSLEVLLSPAEFALLPQRDLTHTACVVLDVLRATTSMITALANGAREILPVPDIVSALELKLRRPEVLLAGERNGWRIGASQTGGIEFDLGNSPREFIPEKVAQRSIVMTTTNGTAALRACSGAELVLVGCLRNNQAVAQLLDRQQPRHLLIVCGGTFEQAALEDTLAAGALADLIAARCDPAGISDSTLMARQVFRQHATDLEAGLGLSRNGRRLLSQPELCEDVAFAARLDTTSVVGIMQPGGAVVRAKD